MRKIKGWWIQFRCPHVLYRTISVKCIELPDGMGWRSRVRQCQECGHLQHWWAPHP